MNKAVKNTHSVEIITDTDLSTIAAQINARDAEISCLMSRSLHLAALIGADLVRVKERLPNGSFMGWCKDNCDIKQHQCNRYMRIAREYPDYTDPEKCPANISINTILELINAPDDVKQLVNEAIADGEVVHQRTIRELSGKTSYPDNRHVSPAVRPEMRVVQPIDTPPMIPHYRMVDHLCMICFGRLLMRRLPGRLPKFEVVCACCEDSHIVDSQENIPCWCSKDIGIHGKIFECIKNPNKKPEIPNAIMVREKPVQILQEIRPHRPVFIANAHECA